MILASISTKLKSKVYILRTQLDKQNIMNYTLINIKDSYDI